MDCRGCRNCISILDIRVCLSARPDRLSPTSGPRPHPPEVFMPKSVISMLGVPSNGLDERDPAELYERLRFHARGWPAAMLGLTTEYSQLHRPPHPSKRSLKTPPP